MTLTNKTTNVVCIQSLLYLHLFLWYVFLTYKKHIVDLSFMLLIFLFQLLAQDLDTRSQAYKLQYK
ncbi:hypothetical protein HanOQP8_Chr15g0561821 [Helianthus annuus]|nr:hypothetical protein HanHA89_Chr15g0602681 [Helianthus annuus]KAJ0651519.1 hypothetical protein HanOQP8_Chr15g0561821 [Helianthus annuus]